MPCIDDSTGSLILKSSDLEDDAVGKKGWIPGEDFCIKLLTLLVPRNLFPRTTRSN